MKEDEIFMHEMVEVHIKPLKIQLFKLNYVVIVWNIRFGFRFHWHCENYFNSHVKVLLVYAREIFVRAKQSYFH